MFVMTPFEIHTQKISKLSFGASKPQVSMFFVTADTFFDLSNFVHRELFVDGFSVWNALSNIENYLKNTPLGKINANIPPGVHLINPESISIGEGSVVEPGAYIKGPCIIGKNCTIRHGAYIRGQFIAGDNCVIGHDTEIKNSIFLNGTQAAHFAYVGDSILGNRVNLGAGVKCANLKLDHSLIAIHWNGMRISTGLKKMGAIIGDGTQIGCNAVINPGTLLGQSVKCYPCVNIGGGIPFGSVVKPNTINTIIPI